MKLVTASALGKALESNDSSSVRNIVAQVNELMQLMPKQRAVLCATPQQRKALTMVIRMYREKSDAIKAVLGVPPESIAPSRQHTQKTGRELLREKRIQKALEREASENILNAIPPYRGQRFAYSTQHKDLTTELISYLLGHFSDCNNDELRLALARRERVSDHKAKQLIARWRGETEDNASMAS